MKYHTTLLEDSIKQFYFYLNIYHPQQLDMIKIAELLKIKIHFAPFSSSTFRGEIIIDSRLAPEQQWEDFGHELCHVLFQYGNQILNINSLFLEYQEWKANNFALHFCVPTFMLQKYKIATIPDGISFITNKFQVRQEIAEKRLIHFRNQLIISNSILK
ncbi:ImmA/IrrE family metallo-endopeptidase [Oceanobacillus sp. FSL K6-0251]|uniref:ImmA/IrrE family metallo-endopeptidase n=1 Tax=Oceanobacillus sp. FSL K6-0251 TaxID=2921602 RepID=UPI0030FCD131